MAEGCCKILITTSAKEGMLYVAFVCLSVWVCFSNYAIYVSVKRYQIIVTSFKQGSN